MIATEKSNFVLVIIITLIVCLIFFLRGCYWRYCDKSVARTVVVIIRGFLPALKYVFFSLVGTISIVAAYTFTIFSPI